MAQPIIQEFIDALNEEITYLKRGKGESAIKLFNGHFLRKMSGLSIYVFLTENFLVAPEDTPAEIEIDGTKYKAYILSNQGSEIEIGIEQPCGQFIIEAKLNTNRWYLLELLKKKYVEHQNGTKKVDFHLSDLLFSTNSVSPGRGKTIVNQEKPRYSSTEYSINDEQKNAVIASYSLPISVIWGPPGTGKTRTIAQLIEAHLNANRRILLVSHANNAVDEALEKVASQLKVTAFYKEGKLIRLGKPQEKHLKIMEADYELVLLDKVASKFDASLIQERNDLEAKRSRIDTILSKIEISIKIHTLIDKLVLDLQQLENLICQNEKKLFTAKSELCETEMTQQKYIEKLKESQSAGIVKRLFFGLDPSKLQKQIELLGFSLDEKRKIITELETKTHELINSLQNKRQQLYQEQNKLEQYNRELQVSNQSIPAKKQELDAQKDIILSRISEINKELDEIQKKVLSEAKLVATTLTKTFSAKQFPDIPFDVLVIDEASMSPLPQIYWAVSRCTNSVTIVGDFLQLPPICVSEGDIAQKWLKGNIFTVLGITTVSAALKDDRVRLLSTQYRMDPKIAMIPNRLFYQGKLQNHPTTIRKNFNDGVSSLALTLIDTSSTNPWCSRISTGGRFNLYNALVAASLAKRIAAIVPGKIGVITPYSAQARLVSKIAKDWGILDRIRVSTVHGFQGSEEHIIIFDSVEGPGTKIAPMLDDTQNTDARLLLNVALTRAMYRFYFIGHIEYLHAKLNNDSALVRIIHYMQTGGKIITSDNIIDNYFTANFEKWADLLLTTPKYSHHEGDLYTEKNFWSSFFQDLKTIKERLIILSPFISIRRTSRIMDYLSALRKRGVHIIIYTRPVNQQSVEMANEADTIIRQLENIGAEVFTRSKMHQKVAIIDNNIAWEGSLNILSHRDTSEQMRRFEGASAIQEIIKNLDLDKDDAQKTKIAEKCPKCGMGMVERESHFGKFLGCSQYPRCDGKLDEKKSRQSKSQNSKTFKAKRKCNECGRLMVFRNNRRGKNFWGCSGYPSCKHTESE